MVQSYWQATSRVKPVGVPPLKTSLSTDVLVVGGGFTGLATAYFLRRRGIRVAVLEAEEPGYGASGRNGGQVLSGWPVEMVSLRETLGDEAARALWAMAEDALTRVDTLVREEHIDCELVHPGHLEAADTSAKKRWLERELSLLESWVPGRLEWWDRSQVETRVGTSGYIGGLYDPRSMAFHPLDYARGLAHAAQSQGALIFGRSAVRQVTRSGRDFEVTTQDGMKAKGEALVLATNAYVPSFAHWLRSRLLPVTSTQIAVTLPRDGALPEQMPTVSDTKSDMHYYRRVGSETFVFGGRAVRKDLESGQYRELQKSLAGMFPSLREGVVTHQWHGRIALTRDFIPHVMRTPEGMWTASGYTGHGAALSTEMGYLLAAAIAGDPPEPLWSVLQDIPWRRFPLSPVLRRVLPTLLSVVELAQR